MPWQFIVAGLLAFGMIGMFFYVWMVGIRGPRAQRTMRELRVTVGLDDEAYRHMETRLVEAGLIAATPDNTQTCSNCALGETDGCTYWRTQQIYEPSGRPCNEFVDLGHSRLTMSVPHQRHCVTCRHRMSLVGQGFDSIVCNRRGCRVTPARGLDCTLWTIRRRGEEEYEAIEMCDGTALVRKPKPKPEPKARTIVRI